MLHNLLLSTLTLLTFNTFIRNYWTSLVYITEITNVTFLQTHAMVAYHLDLNFLIEVGGVGQGSDAPDRERSGEAVPSAQNGHGVVVPLLHLQQHRPPWHVHHL